MSSYEILMGACGWDHTAWQRQYYPEDLPAEWRLAYYGNEFPVVLIPEDYWAGGLETITEWVEESEHRPGFVAEMPSRQLLHAGGLTPSQWLEQLQPLRSRLVGIDCPVYQKESVSELLAPLPEDIPICLEPRGELGDDDLSAVLAQAPRTVGCCWHGHGDGSCMQHGPLSIARLDSRHITPRELRAVVETCLGATSEGRAVVLLADGEPPDLEMLRNAEVILDLI